MFVSSIKPGHHVGQGEMLLVFLALERLPEDLSDWPGIVLSRDEWIRARTLRHPNARRNFMATRSVLRHILGGCLGVDPQTLEWSCNGRGKPRLIGSLEDEGLVFNVSHSADRALIAVGNDLPIGVDIEKVRPRQSLERLAKVIMTPREQSIWITEESLETRTASLIATWASKEALLKATGLGIGGGLTSLEIQSGFDGYRHVPASAGRSDHWQLHQARVDDYQWALTYKGPRHRLIAGWFDLPTDRRAP